MPGCRCAVTKGNNSLEVTRRLNRNVLYHRFPKNENVFALWVQRCRRTDKWNPQNSRVCSEHFTPDDYERDLKSELLSLPEKKHLKASAIPSLLLPAPFGKPNSTVLEQNNQQKRLEIRRRKELVQNLLQNEVISYVPEEENRTQFKEVATETEADDSEAKYNKLQKKYDDLVFSYSDIHTFVLFNRFFFIKRLSSFILNFSGLKRPVFPIRNVNPFLGPLELDFSFHPP
ncbi:hypothetical protein ABEB36_000436 [Hypothenemus hampei]|uniref:THAP-type domain-containing protein n=1 Tax=Hypothenemus hampei TaxID=57062 RepID=A0ABD1FB58_HYPHA